MANNVLTDGLDPEDSIVRQRESINPYRRAAALVWRRLLWDIRSESWSSRKKIRQWRNRCIGQKAVILCNGPSLLKVDFSLLENTFTFGLNKINLLFDKNAFRPSCIVAVNPLVIEQNTSFYNDTSLPLFLDAGSLGLVKSRPNVTFLHSAGEGFARDCSWSVNQGYTVTYVAMQLAFHMGFKEVALVGCDHNFTVKGPANKAVVAEGPDESHFDPSYFARGVTWQLPDLFESEVSYQRAKRTYEAFGRRIVNSTAGGKLELFQRISLDDFIRQGF